MVATLLLFFYLPPDVQPGFILSTLVNSRTHALRYGF